MIKTKNRTIVTKIPHPDTFKILRELEHYEPLSMHGQLPIIWDKAEGHNVWDKWGNKYIDFSSGIAVTNAGHSNPNIINSAISQLKSKLIHSYTYPTEIRLKFIKQLCKTTGFDKAFLLSSGTEATECACKLMRMYGLKKTKTKNVILSFVGAMHGRTMMAEKLKGETKDNNWAEPWDTNIYHLPFPDKDNNFIEDLKKTEIYNKRGVEDICGIMIESYQGWSAGFYPKQYIQDIMQFAVENDILVCFDEIQGGFGRTGKLFAFEHYFTEKEYKPDLVCCGKGISSGFPLSAVLGSGGILNIPEIGSMSSTHSANPLVCAVGLANIKEIISILPTLKKKEKLMFDFLKKKFNTTRVNGNGLVAAVLSPSEEIATKVCLKAMSKGLILIKTGKNSIKIAPPLTITIDALLEGLNILYESCIEVEDESKVNSD